MIHLMRDKLEGLGYQTAFSAKYGDTGLLTSILIAVTILQRDDYQPFLLNISALQWTILVVCVGIGCSVSFTTNGLRSGQAADVYHDMVIGPAVLFLVITLMPVVWYEARWYESLVIIIAIMTWITLIWIDLKNGRFNQRQWLASHGFPIRGEIPHH
jgi:hypothetical protein